MFSHNQRKTPDPSNDTSLIAAGTHITGDVRFAGTLHLDGRVEGTLYSDPDVPAVLTVSEQGAVTGEVRVPHAVINGRVQGDIHVSERLELAANARVDGDVHYRVLEMAAGARVNGRMVHHTEAQASLSAPTSFDGEDDEELTDTLEHERA